MLPIYIATIKDVSEGIVNVSLVDDCAVEVDFITLSKEKGLQSFKSVNEEKHLLTGVIMSANKLIYRNDNGFEYYIKYEPETIRMMSEKLLYDMAHENIDIDHKQELLERGKVVLQEIWIKTPDKPGPFEDIEDGSLLATYHVYDEEIWELCKSDRFNGFSLCGYFTIEQEKQNELIKNKPKYKENNMLKKIKEALKSMLLNFGEVKTDNGILYYDGEEIVEGMSVTNENGEAVEDGNYTLEDGTILEIKDSKVESITKPSTEDEETSTEEEKTEEEETTEDEDKKDDEEEMEEEEETSTEDEKNAEIEALKGEIEALKGEIEAIKEKLNTPMAEPIAEEFKKVVEVKENKAAKIASYLK